MPRTVFLEFKHEPGNLAANGSDITFFIDGRWSWQTTVDRIHDRVAEIRRSSPRASAFSGQLFVGFTYAGGRGGAIKSMVDHDAPRWFHELEDTDPRFAHELRLAGRGLRRRQAV